MGGYTIVDHKKIEDHITFIRIDPTDISLTLKSIIDSLSDISWISTFDKDYGRDSYKQRAEDSIKYITKNIIKSSDDKITANSGEYVVSELARMAIVEHLKYLDIPLAELIKIKDVGNHGFDFYSRNLNEVLLFGEAKYNSRDNAYGSSLEQIVRFVNDKQDISDILDIDLFCCENSKTNFSKGQKGFIAAFASKKTSTTRLINGIKKNSDFLIASKHQELICIAVNI
jgi:hypothetical protein